MVTKRDISCTTNQRGILTLRPCDIWGVFFIHIDLDPFIIHPKTSPLLPKNLITATRFKMSLHYLHSLQNCFIRSAFIALLYCCWYKASIHDLCSMLFFQAELGGKQLQAKVAGISREQKLLFFPTNWVLFTVVLEGNCSSFNDHWLNCITGAALPKCKLSDLIAPRIACLLIQLFWIVWLLLRRRRLFSFTISCWRFFLETFGPRIVPPLTLWNGPRKESASGWNTSFIAFFYFFFLPFLLKLPLLHSLCCICII